MSQKNNKLNPIFIGTYRIEDVQDSLLSILNKFNDLCKKYKISYILDGGTMLGAVRHNGFIPWDDDVDVAMLRKDYKKFVKIAKHESNGFLFESYATNKYWPYNFGKFFKKNTIYEEKHTCALKINHGLFIDVFPMDKTTKHLYKFQGKLSRFWQDVRWTKENIKADFFKPKHKKLLRLFSFLPLWLINFNAEFSMRFLNWLPLSNVSKLCHPGKGKEPHNKSFYKLTVNHDFSNCSFPIPSDFRKWLEIRYKNPFELPPVEQQKPSHFGGKIVL